MENDAINLKKVIKIWKSQFIIKAVKEIYRIEKKASIISKRITNVQTEKFHVCCSPSISNLYGSNLLTWWVSFLQASIGCSLQGWNFWQQLFQLAEFWLPLTHQSYRNPVWWFFTSQDTLLRPFATRFLVDVCFNDRTLRSRVPANLPLHLWQ